MLLLGFRTLHPKKVCYLQFGLKYLILLAFSKFTSKKNDSVYKITFDFLYYILYNIIVIIIERRFTMKKITTGCAFTAHYEELEKFKEFVKTETRFNFSEAMRYLIKKVLQNPSLLQ